MTDPSPTPPLRPVTKQQARHDRTAALITALAIACPPAAVAAAPLPEIFQGHWQPDLDVAANHISETNYECDVRIIKLVKADPVNRTYQIDMQCPTFPPESGEYTQRVTFGRGRTHGARSAPRRMIGHKQ
jgi:hypothetical protein